MTEVPEHLAIDAGLWGADHIISTPRSGIIERLIGTAAAIVGLSGTLVAVTAADPSTAESYSAESCSGVECVVSGEVAMLNDPTSTTMVVEMPTVPPTTAIPSSPETSPSTSLPEPIGEITAQINGISPAAISELSWGVDISWPIPNCEATMPEGLSFGIVGVNGGTVFTRNDCLADEATRFPGLPLSLYLNTGYRGMEVVEEYPELLDTCAPGDENCIAYHYGFKAGEFALEHALNLGIYSEHWWLDVETENSWTPNTEANVKSLEGLMAGVTALAIRRGLPGPKFGIYSTVWMYNKITGGWLNNLPSWVATGHEGPEVARAHCTGYEFTGGPTILVQHVDDGLHLDIDQVCGV